MIYMKYKIKNIDGYPGYRVDTIGDVWTEWRAVGAGTGKGFKCIRTGKWGKMKPWSNKSGHLQVSLHNNKKGGKFLVHTLVLEAFISKRPKGMECCHYNGVPNDNRLENLRWGTRRENMKDRERHGVLWRGEDNINSKLTEKQAIAIITLRRISEVLKRKLSYQKLGDMFSISETQARRIASGQRWGHLSPRRVQFNDNLIK